MPYCALPLTLSGESRRLAGVPMSFQSLGCLSGTSPGRDSVAARSTNAPYASVRPVGPWMTTPPVARQELASTFHVCAAAATSSARAPAPARRSGSQLPRTDVEPPVSWTPNSGSAYSASLGGACSSRTWLSSTSSSSASSMGMEV